mmetsp:Transcript_5277/g.8115  ORF Transcript_5277/g.8115 Transcript_5277/m.8115 type:complete len:204 (-) Transcript_5277:17-628(-)|eukprot:CAMPEP_0203767552 /NCGR_PEP_ID=MMETSP0099_2-20121227/1064_1 /ASSEMBLY_ACC=CAM_ASM_000209 /TAXON_ID=96639 /ORGANISM=" , Strain NY0313808BC1" /LENGTH=203 /DNA_ID=CAMNT_0050664081 /DNA_START=337 /DNA_END=948 /DNA_ORIENTATION=-
MVRKKTAKRGGASSNPQRRHIASAEEMAARDAFEGRRKGSIDSDYNSDVDIDFGLGEQEKAHTVTKAPVFEKDKSLSIADLRSSVFANSALETIETGSVSKDSSSNTADGAQALSRKELEYVEAQKEQQEQDRLVALGQTVESRADLDRLEEIREERERAKARREYEAQKKEKLRQAAAERAAKLEERAKGKGGKKKGGKKRK